MEKKPKDLHYKRAVLKGGVHGTLQHALEAVLKQIPLPTGRMEKLGVTGDERRVIVHEHHHQAILCATMTTHEKDAQQPIMGMALQSADWPIQQCPPPKLPGIDETTFLEGYLFLGVWKNHIVFLPSRSCTSEHLEQYLNFLLRKMDHWPEGGVVELEDLPPKQLRDKKFTNVQAFKFNTTLGSRIAEPEPAPKRAPKLIETVDTQAATKKFKPSGKSWEALRSLIEMVGGKLPEDVLLDSNFDANDVTVRLEVSCAKRKLDKAGPLMDTMANSLRHVTTDLVKFTFEDGTELKGSDLKTRKEFRLDCAGSMPVPQQVDKAINAYLEELLTNGTISADG